MISNTFLGRIEEKKILEDFYVKKGFQNIILYGRRRIGKTRICLEFLKNKKGIYFLCEKNNIQTQAQRLVDKFSQNNNIFPKQVNNFYDAFEFIIENVKTQRYIIVLDEFPYLIEEDKSIPSSFQRIIDELLQNSNIYLIILGSSISIMENEVLAYKSPLYGRRTGQLKILPLKITDLFKWFKNKSLAEIIGIYAIVDSIPAYLEKIDNQLSIDENIKNNFLTKGSFLHEELDFLLNMELREPKSYKRILDAISKGKCRLSEISAESKITVNVLTNYLDTLLNLHIIDKIYPVTEKKSLSRNSLYKFNDNYFSFWFKYVYPYRELIEEEKSDYIIKEIKKSFSVYVSFVFEQVCRQFIRKKFVYQKVGNWWHKGIEIDIVGVNDDNKNILFGEVKWQDNVDGSKILNELKEKSKLVKWNNENRKEKFVLFAKSFKDKNILGCTCYDLIDMEKVFK